VGMVVMVVHEVAMFIAMVVIVGGDFVVVKAVMWVPDVQSRPLQHVLSARPW